MTTNIYRVCSRVMAIAIAVIALYAAEATAQITPPLDLPDRGVLRLQLGDTITDAGLHTPRRIVHEGSPAAGLSQSISARSKCLLELGGSSQLITLTAGGGRGQMGVGPDSIGVFDGPKGVACYRISASEGESVLVGLGASTQAVIEANAFYRIELDMEVKGDAEILLEVMIGGAATAEYFLRSGGSIVDGEGSTEDGAAIFNCQARSDSGPDAGEADNCRWIINELGQEFRLTTLNADASLEGGGDFGTNAYANNSLIYLTEGELGALGCENSPSPESTTTTTIGDGIDDAQCTVTRLDPSTTSAATCNTAIGYIFRNYDDVTEGCELIKTPGEQLAASIDICFPPEPSTGLGDEPLTEIEFTNTADPENPVYYTPARCPGSVALDPNGNRIIPEVLQYPNSYDLIPETDAVEFACILDNEQEYLGTPPASSGSEMQVCQTILFWGDIRFGRQLY